MDGSRQHLAGVRAPSLDLPISFDLPPKLLGFDANREDILYQRWFPLFIGWLFEGVGGIHLPLPDFCLTHLTAENI